MKKLSSERNQSLSKLSKNNQENEAIYIAERDGEFVTVDRANDQEPQVAPLEINRQAETEEPQKELAVATTSPEKRSEQELGKVKQHSSGQKGLVVGVGLGAILTFGGMHLFASSPAENTTASQATESREDNAVQQSVTLAEVKTDQIERNITMAGTVGAYDLIPVKSRAIGLPIEEILVGKGSYVTRGQVLARLDNDVLPAELNQSEAAVKEAEATLAELKAGSRPEEIAQAQQRVRGARAAVVQAESDLDLIQKRVARNKTLEAEGAITRDRLDEILNQEQINQSNLEQARASLHEAEQQLAQLNAGTRSEVIAQAEAALAQARAKVEYIKAQLADTVVVAPANGKIASKNVSVGDLTSASENLFTIIEDDRLELRVEMPETLLGQISPGQTVQVTSDVDSNLQLVGKVREIDPILEEEIPQAIVRIDLPEGTNLKPGMFLRSAITTSIATGKTAPIDALLPQPDGSAIAYVLQSDRTVKAQSVKMGEILPDHQVEVVNGLQSGDRIVVKGAAYLKDGDSVKPTN